MKKIILFMSLITTATAAVAQPGQSAKGMPAPSGPDKVRMTPAERFAKLDTNRDGKVSKAEAANARGLAKHFDQIDANRDGALTPAELASAHAAREKKHMERRSEHFDRMDADKNGTVSREEFLKHKGPGHFGRKGGHGKHGDAGKRPGA